jgi:hypothetical protein
MLTRGEMTPSEWIAKSADAGYVRWEWLLPDSARLPIRHEREVRAYFDAHGDDAHVLTLRGESRMVHADGAVRERPEPMTTNRLFAAGSYADCRYWAPPSDKVARLTLRVLRVTTILQQFREDFDALSASLGHGPYFPWPSDRYGPSTGDGVVDLERLNVLAAPHLQELKLLEHAFDALPVVKQKRAEEQAAERERHAREAAEQRHQMAQRSRIVKATRSNLFAGVPARKSRAMAD